MTRVRFANEIKFCLMKSISFILLFYTGLLYANDFSSFDYPKTLNIIQRQDWGWVKINSKYLTQEPYAITIHHGGVVVDEEISSLKHIQNLQQWSRVSKHWIDIPYHYIIDPKGLIYETRPVNIAGDTNTEYDPTGHILVELMGNFEVQEVTKLQINSLIQLTKFLAEQYKISSEKIKTHRDYSTQTVCPGKNLYRYFENGTIKKLLKTNKN